MSDVLSLLNINMTYIERISEIEKYMEQVENSNFKKLVVTIEATTLNMEKRDLVIMPNGLTDSLRKVKDGIVLFGNKNISSELDFVFPTDENEEDSFPNFAIYFNPKNEGYFIKDFNTGLGALMKIDRYRIKDDVLINIGNNYLVISYEEPNIVIKIFNSEVLNLVQNPLINNYDTKSYDIKKTFENKITIGRSSKCNIVIDDLMLSKMQCVIIIEDSNYANPKIFLYDGDSKKESTNGTWIYIFNSIKLTDNFVFKAQHTLFSAKLVD